MNAPIYTVARLRAAEEATLAEARKAGQTAQAKHVLARVPLYAKALGACRALVVAGGPEAVLKLGGETAWPKEFAPLNVEERKVVRARFLEQLKKHTEDAKP